MGTVAEFNVVGQLLGFIIKDGDKIKYIRVVIEQQEYWIKLAKELRNSVTSDLTPGCWLQLSGTQEIDSGKLKLKAYSFHKVESETSKIIKPPVPKETTGARGQMTVLICQKSTCWKRGGEAVCEALTKSLSDRGLEGQVKVKGTGCMKECKQGPNLVIMPDKTRYSRIKPQEVSSLIDKHFAETTVKV